MKIGIIGYGFVGKALADGLNNDVEICIVDPKLDTKIDVLQDFEPEFIFICLPTPMQENGDQDISIVNDVLFEINEFDIGGVIVIKSTIHPGNIDKIKKITSQFVYNPEFLTEKNAKEDFINSELIIFGGNKKDTNSLANFYSNYTKCINKDFVFTDEKTASMLKYTINTFLATKVIFFNEIYNIYKATSGKESWEDFIKFVSRETRIGSSHMMVPGHDGRYGFGGACFPKDINALYSYAKDIKLELDLIKTVIKTNNKIRASYNSNTSREDEQNINYNNLEEER